MRNEHTKQMASREATLLTLGLYSHLLPNMQQDVVNKWEDAFKGESEEGDNRAQ